VTRGQLPQRAGSLGLNDGGAAAGVPPSTLASRSTELQAMGSDNGNGTAPVKSQPLEGIQTQQSGYEQYGWHRQLFSSCVHAANDESHKLKPLSTHGWQTAFEAKWVVYCTTTLHIVTSLIQILYKPFTFFHHNIIKTLLVGWLVSSACTFMGP